MVYGEEIHPLSIHPGEVVFYVKERGLTLLIESIGSILFSSLLLVCSFKAQIYWYIINPKVKDSSSFEQSLDNYITI